MRTFIILSIAVAALDAVYTPVFAGEQRIGGMPVLRDGLMVSAVYL